MSKKACPKQTTEDTGSVTIRRGTTGPRKTSALGDLNKALTHRRSSSDIDLSEVRPWLEKVHKKGPFSVKDGKVLSEVPLPENFCGTYCARYSPDGSVIAMSFGAGAIQVRLLRITHYQSRFKYKLGLVVWYTFIELLHSETVEVAHVFLALSLRC